MSNNISKYQGATTVMVDFLILYENKNREKDGIFLIKRELENRGYNVNIEQIHYPRKNTEAARVLLVPFLYNNEDIFKFVYKFNGKCQRVINLRWEQVANKQYERDFNCFMYPHGEAVKAIHLCWGEAERKGLLQMGVSGNRAVKVGPVHLDMIKWKKLYKSKEELGRQYGLDYRKKWILFISSFSWTTLSDPELESLKLKLGEYATELINITKKSKSAIIKWLLDFAKEHEDYEVIYRLHPSERNEKGLHTLIEQISNVHISSDDSVAQWIYNSEKVYNWISTSAVQSYVLEKGNTVLRPYEIPDNYDMSIFDSANKIKEYESFCIDVLEKSEVVSDSSFDKYYDIESGFAFKKICDICEKILNTEFIENIDYSSVLKNIPIKTKIKYFIYPVYIHFMYKVSNLKKGNKIRKLLGSRWKAFETASRNTLMQKEIVDVTNRVDSFILSQNGTVG